MECGIFYGALREYVFYAAASDRMLKGFRDDSASAAAGTNIQAQNLLEQEKCFLFLNLWQQQLEQDYQQLEQESELE